MEFIYDYFLKTRSSPALPWTLNPQAPEFCIYMIFDPKNNLMLVGIIIDINNNQDM
jgi:hypothetical protein